MRLGYVAALAFAAGLGSGSVLTWKVMSGAAAKTEVRELKQSASAGRKERARQNAVATEHESVRAKIETEQRETADAFEAYIDARPDLRGIDLGDEWLCLVAQADGRPGTAACRTDRAVPGTAAGSPRPGQDAPGRAADARAVPPVRAAAGRPGQSRDATQR